MSDRLNRKEFYELLWSAPRSVVLDVLGINDFELRMICKIHRIPFPPHKYWDQKKKGLPTVRVVLPPSDKPWPGFAVSEGSSSDESVPDSRVPLFFRSPGGIAYGRQVGAPAPAVAAPAVAAPAVAAPALPAPAVPASAESEQEAADSIEPLTEPLAPSGVRRRCKWEPVKRVHHSVQYTARSLRAGASKGGIVIVGGAAVFHLRIGVESIERTIFILDRLARLFDARGITMSSFEGGFYIRKAREKISLNFREKFEKRTYYPTVEERRRQKEIEFLRRRHPGVQLDDAHPSSAEKPSGELSISVAEPVATDGRRRQWRDNNSATLEAQAVETVNCLADWLDDICEQAFIARRPERLRQRAEANRNLAEARAKREGRRAAFVLEAAERAVTAEKMRAWLSAVGEPEEPATQRMIAWVREEIAWIEGRLAPKRLAGEIQRRELFPEVDPFAPLPDDPDA